MWIEIFKTGNHTDSDGNTRKYKSYDLNQIVEKYNTKVEQSSSYEAPLVKGHPLSNEPAYGWIAKLKTDGITLFAKIKDLSDTLYKEIKAGMFKKISIALYSDLTLRHVGILGAVPPAVQGMKNVEFKLQGNYMEYDTENQYQVDMLDTYIESIQSMDELINNLTNKIEELELKEHTALIEMTLNEKLKAGIIYPSTKKRLSALNYELHSKLSKDEATRTLNEIIQHYEGKSNGVNKKLPLQAENDNENYQITSDMERAEVDRHVRNLMNDDSTLNYEQALNKCLTSNK